MEEVIKSEYMIFQQIGLLFVILIFLKNLQLSTIKVSNGLGQSHYLIGK